MGSPSWPQMTRRISALWTARCLQPLRTSLETLSTATVASSSNWTAHKRVGQPRTSTASISSHPRCRCTVTSNGTHPARSSRWLPLQGFTTSSCGGDCSTSAQCSCCRLYPHLWEHTGISSHCQGPEGSAHLSSANIRPTGQLHCTALNAISTVAVPQPQPHRCHQNAMLRQPSTAVNWAQIGAFGASLQLHTANSSGHTSLAQHCSSATVSHLRMLVPAARQCSCPAKQQQWGRCLHSSSAVTQKSDKPKSPNSSSASTGSSEGREEEYEGLQVRGTYLCPHYAGYKQLIVFLLWALSREFV